MHSRSISSLCSIYPHRKSRLGRHLIFILFLSCFTCLVLLFHVPDYRQEVVSAPAIEPTVLEDNNHDYYSKNATTVTTTARTPRILLVSALYRISHSKHSDLEYSDWLNNFLGQISTDIYFFTSPELSPLIRSSRPDSFPLYLNTTFSTAFSVPPLFNLSSIYIAQHRELDREKSHHSPELYAVWNAKPYFVTQAIQNLERQGKMYDYVFWNDAGSFRSTHWYNAWPDPGRVEQVWDEAARAGKSGKDGEEEIEFRKKDLVFFPVAGLPWFAHRWWKERHGPLDVDFSEGSFFGGSPSAMHWFSQTFYTYHNHYLSRSLFIGKDQSIFNSLFLLFPDRFITTSSIEAIGMDINLDGVCCRQWWYYHFWFGSEEGGEKVRKTWKEVLEEKMEGKVESKTVKEKWERWIILMRWWWRGELEVPSMKNLPPVVPMKSLLRNRFGWGWTPPERYVRVEWDLA